MELTGCLTHDVSEVTKVVGIRGQANTLKTLNSNFKKAVTLSWRGEMNTSMKSTTKQVNLMDLRYNCFHSQQINMFDTYVQGSLLP